MAAGLGSLAVIGYFYGIVRANLPGVASHFIFDVAVAAFFLVHLFRRQSAESRLRSRAVLPWVLLLMVWPMFVAFLPLQDPLVQLVGLRGNIFLLPFLLFGARMTREELYRLALVLAVLNLVAFAFTAAEYGVGIQAFFPRNANTELIYRSADVANGQYRIPSIFTGAHAYAGTMVMSLPLLIGALSMPGISLWRRVVFMLAIFASVLGVFAAASRIHTVVLAVLVLATLFSFRVSLRTRVAILAGGAIVAALVLSQVRLQRFSSLQDSSYVEKRITGSVNANLFDLLLEYPLGNGLGGAGTSLPSFLENRIHHRVMMENEYARIMLEQTLIGLLLWIAFIVWFVSRRFSPGARLWDISEELSWVTVTAYLGTGLLGIGLFTSIPQTMLLLLCAGAATSWRAAELPVFEEAILEHTTT
jgi:hypothetical protein